jgi:hypothetical protein
MARPVPPGRRGGRRWRPDHGPAGGRDVTSLVSELSTAVWAHTTLAAAVECGLVAAVVEPRAVADLADHIDAPEPLVRCLVDVLAALGLVVRTRERVVATPVLAATAGAGAERLRAQLRTSHLEAGEFVRMAASGALVTGWTSTDPEFLEAQGLGSAGGVDAIAGVAALTIAFARRFPGVRCVALEPAGAPLALATRNVEAAGLGEQIDLRQEALEDLSDEAAYDLAWLAIMFLPTHVLELGLRRALRALRPAPGL